MIVVQTHLTDKDGHLVAHVTQTQAVLAAHPEVRDHKLAIIEEFITRWDNDGVCLDFDRDPRLFKEEGKPENAALLTGMIRRIRATLDRVAKERGRPQYL